MHIATKLWHSCFTLFQNLQNELTRTTKKWDNPVLIKNSPTRLFQRKVDSLLCRNKRHAISELEFNATKMLSEWLLLGLRMCKKNCINNLVMYCWLNKRLDLRGSIRFEYGFIKEEHLAVKGMCQRSKRRLSREFPKNPESKLFNQNS